MNNERRNAQKSKEVVKGPSWTQVDSDQFQKLLFEVLHLYNNGPALLAGIKKLNDAGEWDIEKMRALVRSTGDKKTGDALVEGNRRAAGIKFSEGPFLLPRERRRKGCAGETTLRYSVCD